ncbi:MAG TPA: hypothetical protein ENK33_00415, partial [Desulfobacterales bacterium]|nr:hypothetical protein [Desulfobacterales bacterium]
MGPTTDAFLEVVTHHIIAVKIALSGCSRDNKFFLEQLLKKLQLINFSLSGGFNREFFKILSCANNKNFSLKHPPDLQVKYDDLNQEQRKAVVESNQKAVLYLWGPPGTGKTLTLSRIITNFYRQGKSILITSHAHLAVDQLLVKLCNILRDEDDVKFTMGAVQRQGAAKGVNPQ